MSGSRLPAGILALLLAAFPSLAADLPREVQAFVARRDRCDHFRGEESGDPARAAEIARRAEETCRGMDAELARLKARYAAQRAVRARLDAYDPAVE